MRQGERYLNRYWDDSADSPDVYNKYDNKRIIILCLPLVYLTAKFLVLNVLQDKYFFDSLNILQMMQDESYFLTRDKSYQFTATVFSYLNFLNLTTIAEWHIILGLLFSFVFLILILDAREPTTSESFYLFAVFGLLEIFVFTISKDLCQFCIYCIIVLCYRFFRDSKNLPVLGTALVLAVEALLFRTYYGLIAILFVLLITLFRVYGMGRDVEANKKLLCIVVLVLVTVFFVMFFTFHFAETYYDKIASVRISTNDTRIDSEDAVTMINNLFRPEEVTESPLILYVNYLINAIRMLFPFELLIKGVMYIPFCIYQLFTTCYMIRALAKAIVTGNWELCFFLAVYLAYFSVSVMFEPDFGSWVRHEASAFPIMIHLLLPESIAFGKAALTDNSKDQ